MTKQEEKSPYGYTRRVGEQALGCGIGTIEHYAWGIAQYL